MRAIELAILALATWPALRLLSIPPIRREYPTIAWSVFGVLVLYVSVLGAIAVWSPVLLHPLAAIAATILVVERWRARHAYGKNRGLPPGSLSLFPRRPWVDHRFYRNETARWGPIFKCSLLYRPCVCVLGARLGAELLRGHPNDFEAPRVRFNRFIPKGFLRYMEPEDHAIYKPMFRAALGPTVLRQVQPLLREIVRGGLPRLAQESARNPTLGIAPRTALREIVFEMLIAAFYGVRSDTDDFALLRARYDDLDLRKVSLLPGDRDRAALAEIAKWVRGRALQDVSAPGAVKTPCVLTALIQAHPAALDDETALGNVIYSLTIGRADLTGLLMWVLNQLGDAENWADQLRVAVRSQPEDEAHAMAWRIVRETLRLEQSEYVYRRAKRDVQFREFRIPRNWRVRVLVREGHRDPANFADPERFDPDRWLGPGKPGAQFQPFGVDAHVCLGASVTETLSCLLLIELARNYDWEVVSNGPREYGWAHWQPSSKLRIAFTQIKSA
jgi:cytochrome P450